MCGIQMGSGVSVVGLGSDIGGSIRIPAAFCGVFGHKHTSGLVPKRADDGTYPGTSLEFKLRMRA